MMEVHKAPPFLIKKERMVRYEMVDAFKELMDFGIGNIVLILLLLLVFIVALMECWKKFISILGIETKAAIKERELNEKIKKMEKDIEALQCSAKKFNDDRVHDRQQSFGIQQHLTDLINSITETQKEIIKKVDNLTEQSRKYQLADMRETLLQAHRYYTSNSTNPLRMWTELEKHAWDEQYDVYVANKGNGYMQNIIKPEMDKLRVISLDDYETMTELMASRTKNKN